MRKAAVDSGLRVRNGWSYELQKRSKCRVSMSRAEPVVKPVDASKLF